MSRVCPVDKSVDNFDEHWTNTGRFLDKGWTNTGQNSFLWTKCGQSLDIEKDWTNHGQTLDKLWTNFGLCVQGLSEPPFYTSTVISDSELSELALLTGQPKSHIQLAVDIQFSCCDKRKQDG